MRNTITYNTLIVQLCSAHPMPLERTCSSSNCNSNISEHQQEPSVVRAEAIKWIAADRVIYLTFQPATHLHAGTNDVRDKAVGTIINAIFEWHSLYNLCAQVKILATSSSPSQNVIVRRTRSVVLKMFLREDGRSACESLVLIDQLN